MSTVIASTNPSPPRMDRERVITVAFERSRWTNRKAESWLSKQGFRTDAKDFSEPDGDSPGYFYYDQQRRDPRRKYKWVSVGRDAKGIFAIVDAGRDTSDGTGTGREAPREARRRAPRKLNSEIQATALQIAQMALEDDGFRQDVEREFGMSRTEVIALREELNDYLS